MVSVRESMDRSPLAVSAATSVAEVTRLLQQQQPGHRHALVFDEEVLVGVVCACDLERASAGAAVSRCMSAPVQTISINTSVEEATERMRLLAVGCLPVLAGGLLLGILTREGLSQSARGRELTVP